MVSSSGSGSIALYNFNKINVSFQDSMQENKSKNEYWKRQQFAIMCIAFYLKPSEESKSTIKHSKTNKLFITHCMVMSCKILFSWFKRLCKFYMAKERTRNRPHVTRENQTCPKLTTFTNIAMTLAKLHKIRTRHRSLLQGRTRFNQNLVTFVTFLQVWCQFVQFS